MKRLAVLVSGTGSIMESIIDSGLPVSLVIADRECRAITIAAQKGIECELLYRAGYVRSDKSFDRQEFTERVTAILLRSHIELVMMAGFMTILHDYVFRYFENKILNTHPSLLPAFKGDHAVSDAWHFGAKITGCTLHYATPQLDHGPIVDQRAVRRLSDDTTESLHERIKIEERRMVPENLRILMAQ